MEQFQLLSRGGAKFNKKRFESDVKLFNVRLSCLYLKKNPPSPRLLALQNPGQGEAA
jgi:hypothetical protein